MTYFCTRSIRNILTLILLIVGSIPIEAQTALRAKVTEQDTGLPLIGAYIRLSDKPKIIALTDTLGFFKVQFSRGQEHFYLFSWLSHVYIQASKR